MVNPIEAFEAEDGAVFKDRQAAINYNKKLKAKGLVEIFLRNHSIVNSPKIPKLAQILIKYKIGIGVGITIAR